MELQTRSVIVAAAAIFSLSVVVSFALFGEGDQQPEYLVEKAHTEEDKPHKLGEENILFDEGRRLHKLRKYDEAYPVFKETWKLYNATEEAGVKHEIPELQIMDFFQHSAWKLGKTEEALTVSQLLLAKYRATLSEAYRIEFEGKVKVYKHELVHQFLKKNAAKLDSSPVEERSDATLDLANSYCQENFGGHCDVPLEVSHRLGDENVLFDEGRRLHKLRKFDEAYPVFKETWKLYNATEEAGVKHEIPELQIMDFFQHSAWKLGNTEEALKVSQLVLAKYGSTMPEDSRAEFEGKLKVYIKELVHRVLVVNSAKLISLPIEEQRDAAMDLAKNYCQENFGGDCNVPLQVSHILGDEKVLFDEGRRLHLLGKFDEAYSAFKATWTLFNATEEAGAKHAIPELQIMDFLQHSAWKLGNTEEALMISLLVLVKHGPTLSEDNRVEFGGKLKVYKHELVHRFLKANSAKLDSLPVEEQSDAKLDLANNYCQEQFGGNCDVPLEVSHRLGDERVLFYEGFRLHMLEKFDEAYPVFKETWKLYNATEEAGVKHALPELQIMDLLQHSAWKRGNSEEALMLSRLVLAKYGSTMPEDSRTEFERKVKIYKQELVNKFLKENAEKLDDFPMEEQIESARDLHATMQYNYCQDEFANPRSLELASNPNLYCRIDDRGRHPLLIYSPIKEEIVNLDPVAVIMYDIITPEQTEFFLTATEGKLQDAVLGGTGKSLYQRRARTAWVAPAAAKKYTRYLEAATGMNTYDDDGCELYQIGHYGIGGHYLFHYDFMEQLAEPAKGDRIATLMLYLNNPEEGGETAFNNLKIRVNAVKGAGLFWYNMFRNESLDARTLHCGCPVTRGEKWVVNKWFRFRGQFLHKPCGLTPEETFTTRDFILPEWMKWMDLTSK